MDFRQWLLEQSLSKASVSKYYTAIKGVISKWSLEAGIVDKPLLEITDFEEFSKIVEDIVKLPIFQARDDVGNKMYSSSLNYFSEYLRHTFQPDIKADLEDILANREIGETERKTLINTRIGQGKYRNDLVDLWKSCAVTGYSEVSMLRASHIKPWAKSSSKEKLDKYNGFLLLPNIDHAFDMGMITFQQNGLILISSSLNSPEMLGINKNMFIKLYPENKPYLVFHSQYVFKR
ncbi:HNH endonuclease [Kangiella sp. M94]